MQMLGMHRRFGQAGGLAQLTFGSHQSQNTSLSTSLSSSV